MTGAVSIRPGAIARPTLSAPRWLLGFGLALVVPVAVLLLWSLAVRLEWLAPQILPAPSLVWETTVYLIASGELQAELWVSLGRVAAGLALGGAMGLVAGLAFGQSRWLDIHVAPTVRAICLVPSLGWLPFFMLVFGIGEGLKIALIAKTCFLPLMVAACEGLRTRPRAYDEVASVLELRGLDRLRFVTVPAILPSLLTGLRLALSKGWKALIVVEMISSAAGMGYLMMWGRKAFQMDVVFATIVVIGVVGWFIDWALVRAQRRATGWSFVTAR